MSLQAGRRAIAIALFFLGAAGCGGDQVLTRPRALNRPLDFAIACIQLPSASGQPSSPQVVLPGTCRGHLVTSPPADPNYRTLGFVSNTATGELAVAGLAEDTTG